MFTMPVQCCHEHDAIGVYKFAELLNGCDMSNFIV